MVRESSCSRSARTTTGNADRKCQVVHHGHSFGKPSPEEVGKGDRIPEISPDIQVLVDDAGLHRVANLPPLLLSRAAEGERGERHGLMDFSTLFISVSLVMGVIVRVYFCFPSPSLFWYSVSHFNLASGFLQFRNRLSKRRILTSL